MKSNNNVLRGIKVGDRITAAWLNKVVKALNDTAAAVAVPNQKEIAIGDTGGDPDAGLTDLTFTETGRSETTVQVTDSNGDTHDIDQIDQVTLTNGSGDTLILNFTN